MLGLEKQVRTNCASLVECDMMGIKLSILDLISMNEKWVLYESPKKLILLKDDKLN